MTADVQPLPGLMDEGLVLLEAAAEAGILLKAIGGLAIRLRCPSAASPPLHRTYKDIDLVGLGRQRQEIGALLAARGYVPDTEFNTHHGATRLMYEDVGNGRGVDVFLDRLTMCHELDLRGRLDEVPMTLDTADLLLTKLQVVQINERDLKDAVALLADGEVDEERVASVLAADWGWWRTCTEVLGKVQAYVAELPPDPVTARASATIESLAETIERHPKSLRWRTRARVGERIRWYDLPDEVAG